MRIGRSDRNLHDFVRYLRDNPSGIFVTRQVLNASPVTLGGAFADTPDVTIWLHPTSPPPDDQVNFALSPQMEELILTVNVGDFCFTGDGDIYVCSDATVGALVWDIIVGIGGAASWGTITGTLADQTDLQTELADIGTLITDLQTEVDAKSNLRPETNQQTGTTYTLALTDEGKIIQTTNGATVTVTVPPNVDIAFPVGAIVGLEQYGAGALTVAPGAGVTIRSLGGSLVHGGQYTATMLRKLATNEWMLTGTLA